MSLNIVFRGSQVLSNNLRGKQANRFHLLSLHLSIILKSVHLLASKICQSQAILMSQKYNHILQISSHLKPKEELSV